MDTHEDSNKLGGTYLRWASTQRCQGLENPKLLNKLERQRDRKRKGEGHPVSQVLGQVQFQLHKESLKGYWVRWFKVPSHLEGRTDSACTGVGVGRRGLCGAAYDLVLTL